jgi:hypothetical protein
MIKIIIFKGEHALVAKLQRKPLPARSFPERYHRWVRNEMRLKTMLAFACLAILTGTSLPETGPLPETKPDTEDTQPTPSETPVPQEKPAEKPAAGKPAAPANTEQVPEETAPAEEKTGEMQGPPKPPLTIASEPEDEHQECEKELQAMGAVFKDVPRIDDGNGCGIDKPISLTEALPGIKLKPEGTMRCQTALALAHWMKQSVIPSGEVALKDAGPIVTINQASTYICRLRNTATTGKISEHARGNAVDVASFTFQDGTVVAVQPRKEDSTLTGAFQRAVSAAGCLYFTTVLDPESDANHEHHFHLDVIERHGGFRYCH